MGADGRTHRGLADPTTAAGAEGLRNLRPNSSRYCHSPEPTSRGVRHSCMQSIQLEILFLDTISVEYGYNIRTQNRKSKHVMPFGIVGAPAKLPNSRKCSRTLPRKGPPKDPPPVPRSGPGCLQLPRCVIHPPQRVSQTQTILVGAYVAIESDHDLAQ